MTAPVPGLRRRAVRHVAACVTVAAAGGVHGAVTTAVAAPGRPGAGGHGDGGGAVPPGRGQQRGTGLL
jgi:hypothetical protein